MKHLLLLLWVIFSACVAMLSFHDLKWAGVSYVLCVFHSAYNGWGVFWSKLTELLVKCNRLVFCGNGSSFQWYFTGPNSFSGILRKSTSFDATEPIFPILNIRIGAGNKQFDTMRREHSHKEENSFSEDSYAHHEIIHQSVKLDGICMILVYCFIFMYQMNHQTLS